MDKKLTLKFLFYISFVGILLVSVEIGLLIADNMLISSQLRWLSKNVINLEDLFFRFLLFTPITLFFATIFSLMGKARDKEKQKRWKILLAINLILLLLHIAFFVYFFIGVALYWE